MLLYHFLIPCILIHIGKLPIEWAIVFQFDGLCTDINLVCGCALMVVWSATFPKLSLVSSNVIVMLASKLVSTVVLRNFTIVICSLLFLRHENTFLSYKNQNSFCQKLIFIATSPTLFYHIQSKIGLHILGNDLYDKIV